MHTVNRLVNLIGKNSSNNAFLKKNVVKKYELVKRNLATGFTFTDEQKTLQETTKSLCDEYLKPNQAKIDSMDEWDNFRNFFKQLGSIGLLGITSEEKYGGLNMGYFEHCLVMEEISRASGGIGLSYGAHSNLCINQLTKNGTDRQKQKYLPKLISGEHIGALAMSEVEAGSDVMSMRTFAREEDDHFVIDGSKYWITNATDADVFIIYAKTVRDTHSLRGPITAFIVEKGTQGFSQVKINDKLGMRGSKTAELIFENCKIPKENILGSLNKGSRVLMSGLDYERLVLSAGPVGLMQAAVDHTFQYCHERRTFKEPIGKHQIVQAKMADMYTALLASRSMLYSVSRMVDSGSFSSMNCASLILYTAESATRVALDAIQLQGGAGYMNSSPASIILRDAKLYEIGAGTSEIRRWLIGREINKLYSL